MSWGTTISNVYIRRVTEDNVDSVIEDLDRGIRYYRDKLMVLAASAPHNVASSDDQSLEPWDSYVQREIDQLMEQLVDDAASLRDAYRVKEHFEYDVDKGTEKKVV